MDSNSRPNSVDSFQAVNNSPNNHFYHHSTLQENAMSPPQTSFDSSTLNQSLNQSFYPSMVPQNDYMNQYSLYVQQYYREYYRQWLQQHNSRAHMSSSSVSSHTVVKQPLKYGSHSCHSRAVFSQHNNTLLVLDNTSTSEKPIRIYSLSDLFIDYLFPNQLFNLLLRGENQLPFSERESCLQWIRCKQQLTTTSTTGTTLNFELKLILKIIQMILKQNSTITGLDLTELLFDLIDEKNVSFVYSENEFKNQALNRFRALLMRGQKTLALNSALTSGLMDHALCLSFLMSNQVFGEEVILKTIKKFCDSLHASDPIRVLYNCLFNEMLGQKNFLELSFESFLVLLSNDLDLSSVSVKSEQFQNLLAFVKSLMKKKTTDDDNDDDDVLSDTLFDSEFDSILVNECLEFSRFSGNDFNPKLIEKKVKFVSILFDFGFISNSLKYCQQLRTFSHFSKNCENLVNQIETRFNENIVFQTFRDNNSETEDEIETTPDVQLSPIKEIIPNVIEVKESELFVQNSFEPISSPSEEVIESPIISSMTSELEIPFSFVSNSFTPLMPFNTNQLENSFSTKNQISSEDIQKKETTADDSSLIATKGANNPSFLSKLLPFNFKTKNQAILPDDSKMTLVFDKNTNQWIDTSLHNGATSAQAPPPLRPPPPPVVGPGVGVPPEGFGFRSKKRYVDITRK